MIILGIVIGVIFGIIIGACLAKVDASNENENTKLSNTQVEKPKYTPIERPTRAPIEKPTNTQTETLTKTQIKNEKLKDNILEEMEIGKVYTISELIQALACCNECTNQKISALMRQLWVEEKVDRFEDNGKYFFTLA